MSEIKFNISDERLGDLLCSAFEGGSNYWVDLAEVIGTRPKAAKYIHEIPLHGGELLMHVNETEDEPIKGKGFKFTLNRASLDKGIQIMANKHPRHFADVLNENEDAITGDVFLQCCLFDDTIYG